MVLNFWVSARLDIWSSKEVHHDREPVKVSDKTLGIYVLALLFFWTTVFAYAVHPVLPANPLELPLEEKSPLVHFLPQGWAFFTRDPRSMDLSAFVRAPDSTWHPSPAGKRFWPHLPNFSRRWKLAGIEVGIVLSELPDWQWQTCQELPTTCLEKTPLSGTIENIMSPPSLCGEVGLVRQPPIPWAWSHSPEETVMPSEVLRFEVSCHD